jgi:hypothetical protein
VVITGLRIWRDGEGWSARKSYRRPGVKGSSETTGASFARAFSTLVIPNAWYVWRYKRSVGGWLG